MLVSILVSIFSKRCRLGIVLVSTIFGHNYPFCQVQILKAIANEQLLSEGQLVTFMVEAECIINDRPIASVSNDPRDLQLISEALVHR
jgi:hypothetical protein